MRIFTPIAAVAIALAAPAFAATMTEKSPTPEAVSAAQPAAPMPADPAVSMPAPAEAAPAAAPAKSVADVVAGDWSKYDTANKGVLNKSEFGKWMTTLRTSAGQPAPDAAWLKTAFAQTDTDKNAKISSAELTTFLSAAG